MAFSWTVLIRRNRHIRTSCHPIRTLKVNNAQPNYLMAYKENLKELRKHTKYEKRESCQEEQRTISNDTGKTLDSSAKMNDVVSQALSTALFRRRMSIPSLFVNMG